MEDPKTWVLALTWPLMSFAILFKFLNLISSVSPFHKKRKWVGGLVDLMISKVSPRLKSPCLQFYILPLYFLQSAFYKHGEEVLLFFVIWEAQFWAVNPDLNPGLRWYKRNPVKIKDHSVWEKPAEHRHPGVFLIDGKLRGATLQTPLDPHDCMSAFYTTEPCLVSSPLPKCLTMVTLIWARNPKSEWSFV